VCGGSDAEPIARGYDYEYRTSRAAWTYVRCRECALVYLNPRPAVTELARIYPPHYYSFDETKRDNPLVGFFRRRLEAMKARVFARLLEPGPRRILDVGCGDGRFLSVLRDHGPKAWELHGIDIDARAVERAASRGVRAQVSRLEDYDPGAERFDMVVLFQVIEHVSAPDEMARRVHDLLVPGGLFVIETPDVAGWDEALFRDGLWGGYHIPRHWNLFTPDNLARMLARAGFERVLAQPLISTSFWINSLYNWALVRGAGERTLGFLHYQNPLLLAPLIVLDKLRMPFGARTSNQRLVVRSTS
jgi:2-polyprenyl-3-methyl-5-hydroxy-6-metoxy-1,4-benzoquinol methylase